MIKNVEILIGVQASGKSSYAEKASKLINDTGKRSLILSSDKIRNKITNKHNASNTELPEMNVFREAAKENETLEKLIKQSPKTTKNIKNNQTSESLTSENDEEDLPLPIRLFITRELGISAITKAIVLSVKYEDEDEDNELIKSTLSKIIDNAAIITQTELYKTPKDIQKITAYGDSFCKLCKLLEKIQNIRKKTRARINHDVFKEMKTKLIHAIKDPNVEYDTVFYDAINLNRKKRNSLYNLIKTVDSSVHVTATVILQPLKVLLERNSYRSKNDKVPENVLIESYRLFQPPRILVDCDEIKKPEGNNAQSFANEFCEERQNIPCNKRAILPENLTYKTLKEYENDIMYEASKNPEYATSPEYYVIAKWGEKGKPMARIELFDEEYVYGVERESIIYPDYNNLSSMYYLASMSTFSKQELQILEVIYQQENGNELAKEIENLFVGKNQPKTKAEKIVRYNKLSKNDVQAIVKFNKLKKSVSVLKELPISK